MVHCRSLQTGAHASTRTPCTLCDQPAIFHWTQTYPDLLLCAECLVCYPEVDPRDQDTGAQLGELVGDR